MRHGKKNNHLGRKAPHRKAMISNMACSLIAHKRINTTLAKAKVLRREIEPILTKSKEDTTHNRRMAFRFLRDKYAVTELFREVSNKIADRPGGYTRIIRLGNRLGDNADMAMIELVDYNELYSPTDKPKKSTRRSRSRKLLQEKKSSPKAEETTTSASDKEPKSTLKSDKIKQEKDIKATTVSTIVEDEKKIDEKKSIDKKEAVKQIKVTSKIKKTPSEPEKKKMDESKLKKTSKRVDKNQTNGDKDKK